MNRVASFKAISPSPRTAMRPRWWALTALVSMLVAGCVTTSSSGPVPKVSEPVMVAIALVRDEPATRQTYPVPEALLEAIVADLGRRNLQVKAIGEGGYDQAIARVRSTPGRMAALSRQAEGAPLILLVETRAAFYSQLSGRYRWSVEAKLSLAPTADLLRSSSVDVSEPAFLFFDHQREDQAVSDASGRIARRVGSLVDDAIVAGWPGIPEVIVSLGRQRAPVGEGSAASPAASPDADWKPLPAPQGDAVYFAMVDRFARPDADQSALEAPQAFFGGTIGGLRSRIDWLHGLGVGTLWLSPVYLSRETLFHGWGPFHGYWVEDHMAPWPRLGSFADLRALSDELRARDMRLLLDVVVNHVGYDAPLVTQRPDWFNRIGSIEDWSDPEQLVFGEVHGLPDLNQDNPEVYDYLLEHAKLWIDEVRPDGFRLDAVKHVPLSFWRRFNADVKAHAGEDFFLLGEDLEGDPVKLAKTLHQGHFDALFDFPVHFALVDVFCRDAPVGRLASMLSMDHLYGEEAGRRLVTFLDNHDLPRILSVCGGDVERVQQALTVLAALRGTPALTWGTETGLTGEDEPANRAPMRFDDDHPLHQHVKSVLSLREKNPWLVHADTMLTQLDEELLVLIRPWSMAFVLVINRSAEAREVNFPSLAVSHGRSLPDGEALEGGRMVVGPRSVGIFELDTAERQGLGADFARMRERQGTTTAPGPSRSVIVRAADAPQAEGHLVLVGAGDALGHWDLAQAPRFDEGATTLSLPAGLVAEYKLAFVGESESRWEAGPNRYLLVTPGDDPLEVELTWRREG